MEVSEGPSPLSTSGDELADFACEGVKMDTVVTFELERLTLTIRRPKFKVSILSAVGPLNLKLVLVICISVTLRIILRFRYTLQAMELAKAI